jgi:trehalose-phosphatase
MMPRALAECLPEIAAQIESQAPILLGLDFDGTLAPICPHPDEAQLAASVRNLLHRLASLPRVTMMIVSGRSLADVASRVGLPELIYAGNHGLEIQGQGLAFLEPTAAALVYPLADLVAQLKERLAAIPGALVEPKGLTASVHYRNVSPDLRDEVDRRLHQVMAHDLDRFALNPGHHVWEVRPRVSWHKGQAIHWVLQHLPVPMQPLIFYLGDDRTDEDAFAALPNGVTIKIGREPISTLARYHAADPIAVERFLCWIADRVDVDPDGNESTDMK